MQKAISNSATTADSPANSPIDNPAPAPSSPSAPSPPASTPKKRQKKRVDALDVVEYASIVGAGAGVVVSAMTQQLVHFALPFTLAIGMGTLNRQRLQQRMQKQYVAAVAQLQNSLKNLPDPVNLEPILQQVVTLDRSYKEAQQQIQQLRQEVRAQARPEQIVALRNAIVNLQNDLQQMQEFVNRQRTRERHLLAQITELREWFQRLPRTQQSAEAQQVENAIAVLQHELSIVKGRLAPLESTNLDSVQQNIKQLEEHVQQLSTGVAPLQRQQRDIVRRLFPRLISTIKDIQKPEVTQAQKAAIDRPPLPEVNNVIRTASPLNQATPRPDPKRLAAWQAQVQANMLRQRQQQRNQQQQRQSDRSV